MLWICVSSFLIKYINARIILGTRVRIKLLFFDTDSHHAYFDNPTILNVFLRLIYVFPVFLLIGSKILILTKKSILNYIVY